MAISVRSNTRPTTPRVRATASIPTSAISSTNSAALHLLLAVHARASLGDVITLDPAKILSERWLGEGWTLSRITQVREVLQQIGWLESLGDHAFRVCNADPGIDDQPAPDVRRLAAEAVQATLCGAEVAAADQLAAVEAVSLVLQQLAAEAPAPALTTEDRDREVVAYLRQHRRPGAVMILARRYAVTGEPREIESLARRFRRLRARHGLNRRHLRPRHQGIGGNHRTSNSDGGIPGASPSP